MEIYEGVPIFYSLGNFMYETDGLDFRAADQFDAGSNLYTRRSAQRPTRRRPSVNSIMTGGGRVSLAVATVERGTLSGVKLYPLSLKATGQAARKGVPRLATGAEADTILRQISALSKRLGTDLGEGASGAF